MKKKMQDQVSSSEFPSVHWEKFFNQFVETDTLDVKVWKIVHIIAYFCKLYENHYGVKFTFKFNSPAPSKSFEVYNIKKLGQMLSTDPVILKEYIDWWFQNKVVLKKKRITTMAFFVDPNIVNEYKFKYLISNKTIDKATNLPQNYLNIIIASGFDNLKTYGDLAFYKQITESNPEEKYWKLMIALKRVGLNLSILDKVR